MVDKTGHKRVTVRYRDPQTLERKVDKLTMFPYVFVEDRDAEFVECMQKEEGYVGLYGEEITKCIFADPWEASQLKKRFNKTWECNIRFTNRCLVDSGKHYEYYKHRIWYVDAEWIPDKDDELCVISAYDTYMDKMLTWYVDPNQKETMRTTDRVFFNNDPDGRQQAVYPIPMKVFNCEEEMLKDFVKTLQAKDPDVLAGWWFLQADIATLFKRLDKCGLDAKSLSPNGKVFRDKLGDYDQPISGRLCIDLMKNFVRLWEVKNGKLPGQSLDDVSEFCLGDRKVVLPDGHDSYYTDLGLYVDYNRKDVWLMPKLDSLVNCIEHYINIQHIIQCDFTTTPYVTRLTNVMILRDEKFSRRIPSEAQFAKVDYQGADIQEPEEGLYEKVAIMDVKAMYHSNISKENISWETLQADGSFDKSEKGLLCRMMDLLTDLRNQYKAEMKKATSKEDRKKWDSAQYATKSLVASLYGVCGDSRFGMYHPEVASAITRESRNTLFTLRDECEALGMKCIYGHTDSVFVHCETPEEGVEKLKIINANMAPIETEFEKWCESMLLKAKNRYAGKVVWTDGQYHEPDYYVKGIEVIQARMPQAMKESMMMTLRAMLDGTPESALTGQLCEYITKVVDGEVPAQDLAMKGKLKRNLWQYRTIGGSAAAALWAKENLGKEYKKGDFFWTLFDESGKYIGGDSVDEIMGKATIGYRVFAERYILKKVQPLYEIAGWNMHPLTDALNGRKPTEWL